MDSSSVISSLGSWYGVMGTLTGVAVTIAVVWRLCRRRCRKRAKIYPADTLIVHQFGRGLFVPNQSPFCLKLETYLRMAKIPYQNDLSNAMSSKSKSPWMTYNGQDIADSQFCIEFVNKKFEVDLNTSLSERDQAVALAFRKLIEDNFYWCMVMWRFVYDSDWTDLRKVIRVPYPILLLIQRAVKKQAFGQGMGRHSREEVLSIADADLRALSDFLGTKKFFMGDTPTEIDACVFASLAQIKWQMQRSPWEKLVKDELVNLSDYCDMMKRLYWPDWDDCITHGATKKAAA